MVNSDEFRACLEAQHLRLEVGRRISKGLPHDPSYFPKVFREIPIGPPPRLFTSDHTIGLLLNFRKG
jgi:hypothetical protein